MDNPNPSDLLPGALPPDISLRWRRLNAADLPAIMALHHAVLQAVATPGLVKPEDEAFFTRLLNGHGEIMGAFVGEQLIAYGVLQWALAGTDDPRKHFGLRPDSPLAKLAGASVHRDYWGYNLHNALIDYRCAQAQCLGYAHLYSTSAPGNWRSWTNLLDSGFVIRAMVQKYGSLWRFLLHRQPAPPVQEAVIAHDPEDLTTLQNAFAHGTVGVGWRRDANGNKVLLLTVPDPS